MATYDDLAAELGIDLDDPNEAFVRDLSLADDKYLEDLVVLRKSRGMSQRDVANALDRPESEVAEFETLGADPALSTLRRYAAAVGAQVRHTVEPAKGLEFTCQGVSFSDHVDSEFRHVQWSAVNLALHAGAAFREIKDEVDWYAGRDQIGVPIQVVARDESASRHHAGTK